jgi:hypothetical protein
MNGQANFETARNTIRHELYSQSLAQFPCGTRGTSVSALASADYMNYYGTERPYFIARKWSWQTRTSVMVPSYHIYYSENGPCKPYIMA